MSTTLTLDDLYCKDIASPYEWKACYVSADYAAECTGECFSNLTGSGTFHDLLSVFQDTEIAADGTYLQFFARPLSFVTTEVIKMRYGTRLTDTSFEFYVSFCAFEPSDIFGASSSVDVAVYLADRDVDLTSWTQSAGSTCTNMVENTHYKVKEPSCRTGTDAFSICSENADFSTKYDTLSDLSKITVKA